MTAKLDRRWQLSWHVDSWPFNSTAGSVSDVQKLCTRMPQAQEVGFVVGMCANCEQTELVGPPSRVVTDEYIVGVPPIRKLCTAQERPAAISSVAAGRQHEMDVGILLGPPHETDYKAR